MILPVIIAGGSGTRLWPLSRTSQPKQFLALNGKKTMIQQTVERLSDLPISKPVTICNEEHRFFVAEQLREIDSLGKIILEPVGRNTAAAIALAAINEQDHDPLLLVLPADNVIEDQVAFTSAVSKAVALAEEGKLVTFGVVPRMPHTGYGYIKKGRPVGEGFTVEAFREKPSADLAAQYLDSGNYYWNSGMFLFKATRFLSELRVHRPDIYESCMNAMSDASTDLDFIRIDGEVFAGCPAESIDYAVMEKTSAAAVVPLDAGWDDVGSWSSLWEKMDKDRDGNATVGDVITYDSSNSLVRANDDRLITLVGVSDLVVVSTKDAVLVAEKSAVQNVKAVVEILKGAGRSDWVQHREVYRPWGKYDSIDSGSRYQVKRITVRPGEKLSLQMHHHRAEHWIVVSGCAMVTNGEKTLLLTENESTYIPIGAAHSLENPGKVPLEIIEVQSGAYLGEDDIVRIKDKYGRV